MVVRNSAMASSSCREQARVSPSCGLEEKVNLEIGGKGPSVAKVSKIGVREEGYRKD